LSRSPRNKTLLFLLFVASGFCGLLYQIVWVRLAFAAFGVITPVLSVVLSVFMLGLALGSWAGGRWIGPITARMRTSAIWFYALVEVVIGVGAFVVPHAFDVGEAWLLSAGQMDSARYLLLSASILCLSLLPWCVFMGATFPVMMSYVCQDERPQPDSFSYLYLANVIGAMCGTLVTACVLVELLGFHGCLTVAGCTNFLIAATAAFVGVAWRRRPMSATPPSGPDRSDASSASPPSGRRVLMAILFATGFVSMAMEVVWTRAFTPVLKTTIYAFAALLAAYLLATWLGSWIYRRHLARGRAQSVHNVLAFVAVCAFLPVLLNDPRWHASSVVSAAVALASIFPFCAGLGYLTPKLIDAWSGGAPRPAGAAYAVNIVGCILGPLFAGYVLLPCVGVRIALVLLAIVPVGFYVCVLRSSRTGVYHALVTLGGATALVMVSVFCVVSHEDGLLYGSAEVRRDPVATVISHGKGMNKRLLVNGIGMTHLSQITKNMAHMPLAVRAGPPQSALAVCMGMGTTFRSLVSWGVKATAVELVPSVRDAFGFYFQDAQAILDRPDARVVVDDGRRFLKRTSERFDLITIDPPPPVEAAGCSLLYSEDFYRLAKSRLTPDGILQQWLPGGDRTTIHASAKAIRAVFPHVRVFQSSEGWGHHFFASMRPFEMPDAATFAARFPPAAAADLVEWCRQKDVSEVYQDFLRREVPLSTVLPPDARCAITDDRPINEYFLLRRVWRLRSGGDELPQ